MLDFWVRFSEIVESEDPTGSIFTKKLANDRKLFYYTVCKIFLK